MSKGSIRKKKFRRLKRAQGKKRKKKKIKASRNRVHRDKKIIQFKSAISVAQTRTDEVQVMLVALHIQHVPIM
jgi:hypothetical protein